MMRRVAFHAPSGAMVVAMIALIVAVGGTAFAGPVAQLAKNSSGDKIIKKRSLSGNRLRKHTITGTEVKLSKLGTVPQANTANLAANANALGGQAASAFFPAGRVQASGLVKASKGQTVTVKAFGPFTLTLKCEDAGGGMTKDTLTAKSTEASSELDGPSGGPLGTSNDLGTHTSATVLVSTGTSRSLIAPSGAYFQGVSDDGVNALGADCFAAITGISS